MRCLKKTAVLCKIGLSWHLGWTAHYSTTTLHAIFQGNRYRVTLVHQLIDSKLLFKKQFQKQKRKIIIKRNTSDTKPYIYLLYTEFTLVMYRVGHEQTTNESQVRINNCATWGCGILDDSICFGRATHEKKHTLSVQDCRVTHGVVN